MPASVSEDVLLFEKCELRAGELALVLIFFLIFCVGLDDKLPYLDTENEISLKKVLAVFEKAKSCKVGNCALVPLSLKCLNKVYHLICKSNMAQCDPKLHINDTANWKIRRGGKGNLQANRVKPIY